MDSRTKFHQNRSNGCRDIAFNVFQNGGRPPSWIFIKLTFCTFLRVQRDNVRQCAKFHRNQSNRCSNIAIYPFLPRESYAKRGICRGQQMQVGWVKIGHFRRKTRYNRKRYKIDV